MTGATWFLIFHLCMCPVIVRSDSCCNENPTFLPHMNQRIVGHKLEAHDVPLCDAYLDEGWYNLTERFTIARSPQECGTDFNWYLKDPLPTVCEESLTVCKSEGNGRACTETKTIKVKKCSAGYIFYLEPLDGCAEAFCIESIQDKDPSVLPAPDISNVKPEVNVEFIPTQNAEGRITNVYEFYCDITPPDQTNHFYVVEWSLHTGLTLANSLHISKVVQHQGVADFRRKTLLKEAHLKQSGIRHPGFTLSCSVKAQSDMFGDFSLTQSSPPKYYGLQMVNSSQATVRVLNAESVTIFFKLTLPFGCIRGDCFLDFNVFLPTKTHDCKISQLKHNERQSTECGLRFYRKDVTEGVLKPFEVKASFGKSELDNQPKQVYDVEIVTPLRISNQPFFQDYKAASIRVELSISKELLKNKQCLSVSDPHMLTFDGLTYDNHQGGTFIMYKHKELEIEVQTQTSHCANYFQPWKPWCNCGVAVRAGKDIFIINRCGSVFQPPRMIYCEDGVLSGNVKGNNNIYKIYLPSGGIVELTDDGHFINVKILPSLVDYEKTEGLCGFFDSDTTNDLEVRKGSTETDSSKSWSAKPTENLFNESNYKNLTAWSEMRHLCSCDKDPSLGYSIPTPSANCDTARIIKCSNEPFQDLRQPICDFNKPNRRKRRSGEIEFDGYFNAQTAYVRKKVFPENPKPILVKRAAQIYNKTSAHQECIRMINTTIFQMCSNVPGLQFESFIDNCVADALLTDSMEWTMSHLESIKQKCIHHVDAMQPIPPEVIAEVTADPFSNSTNTTDSTASMFTNPPVQELPIGVPFITPELLSSLTSIACPNECSGNGLCNNGTCICNEPFISFDCSIDKTKPPIMLGIPDKGTCDLQVRKCAETAVFGKNFAAEKSMKCKLIPFQVDIVGNVTLGNDLTTNGFFESLNEVYCQFPQSRSKRSTSELSDDFISRGYHVAISNDGIGFSDSDSIVIFDSKCVNCTKVSNNIICTTKPNYCMHNGYCYDIGEEKECYTCMEITPNHAGWLLSSNCAEQVIPEESKKLWIIGAVLGPFAAVFIAVVATIYCIWMKKQMTRAKVGSITDFNDK